MPRRFALRLALEALGINLTIRNVTQSSSIARHSFLEGLSVKEGRPEALRSAPDEEGLFGAGSFSLYCGVDKVGTLKWSDDPEHAEFPFCWTPASLRYRSSLFSRRTFEGTDSPLYLKVSRAARNAAEGSFSVGHLGLSGL